MRSTKPIRGAFVLHDPRINVDNMEANTAADDTSDYTQQGSRPGSPTRDDPLGTYLPGAHNGQLADIHIRAVSPGLPRESEGAGIAYREATETSASLRGWCEPNLLLGFEPVEWVTGSDVWNRADAVTCPRSGTVIAVASEDGSDVNVSAWVWSPTTRTWGSRTSIASGRLACACVIRATNRVLVFIVETVGGGAKVYSSDDEGATWDEYAPAAMRPAAIDADVYKVHMLEDLSGNLVLIAVDESNGDHWHYVSTDQGATWEEYDSDTGLLGTSACVNTLSNGTLLIVYTEVTSGGEIRYRILPNAFSLVADSAEGSIYTTLATGTVAVAVDPGDGAVYVFAEQSYAAGPSYQGDRIMVIRGLPSGESWSTYDYSLIQQPLGGVEDIADRRRCLAATWSGGEAILLMRSGFGATTPATDGSLLSLVCGGWSSLENGDTSGRRSNRFGWAETADADANGVVLPIETFDNQGWTHTGTAETLAAGLHRFNPAAAQSYAAITAAGHAGGGFAILLEVKVVSGGNLGTDQCAFIHRRRDGAAAYILRIRFTTTGYRVRDGSGAGSTLGSDVAVSLTSKTQIMVVYDDLDTVTVFHRASSASVWTQGVTGTLGSDASAATTDQYEIGCIDSATADFRVGLLCIMQHSDPFHAGASNDATTGIPRLKWGRAVTPIPTPVRDQIDADGFMLGLSGRGGVARFGETWEIAAEWDYGARHLDPVQFPSPRRSWRSEADDAEQVFVWDLGSDTRLGSSWIPAMGLYRTNVYRAFLEASTNAAPTDWVELGQYDSRIVVAGTFTREGNLVWPASNTPRGKRFVGDGHCAQGFVIFDPSGTPVVRKIKNNSAGNWSPDGQQCYLELEDIDGTEPTSGTVHVFAGYGLLVCSEAPIDTYRRVRLRIPAQETPAGYLEIGSLVIGAVHAMGRQHSRGWSWRHVPIIRESEDAQGVTFYEPRIDVPDSTYRRELTLSWQDGAFDAKLGTNPRYLAPKGSDAPLVTDHDVFRQLVGLMRRSRGGQVPAAALLEVPDYTTTITDPLLTGFGRLIGTPQRNNVQGNEGRNEISRTESILFQEIP